MGNGIAFMMGGALQGIGQGMMYGEMQKIVARRDLALATARKQSDAALQLEEAGFIKGTPEYQTKMKQIIDAGIAGKANDRGRIITPQPGGGAFRENPDGSIETIIGINPGNKAFGSPVNNTSGPATKRIGGTTYYSGGNGKWYDDPSEAQGAGGSTSASSGFRIPYGNPLDPPRR